MDARRALKLCQQMWGKAAAVKVTPNAARIGLHGEYVSFSKIGQPKNSPHKVGRYRCEQCSTITIGVDTFGDTDAAIVREVWHKPGGWQAEYKVGIMTLGGMFFEVRGEGPSFDKAIEEAQKKRGKVPA